jgi:hypothetical protein
VTRRVLLVVGLVLAVAVVASGLVRWLGATSDRDDAEVARDEQAAATAELRREVKRLEALAADTRQQARAAVGAVARVLVRSDDHVDAARDLLDGRVEQVLRLRNQDFDRYGRFIRELERQEDAVHRSQVSLFAALDPLDAALVALERRLAAVAG